MSLIPSRAARSFPALVVAVLAAAALTHPALAAGPFGVGLPEPAPSGGGFLPGVFSTIAQWQSSFYRELTGTVKAMHEDGWAAVWLCVLAFAYGVVHAAGPGHGKAIVSAYVLANRETARNGAVLSLVSALAQGVTAVALVSIAALVLGATSIAMTEAAKAFETGAFALVTALGLWLVWRKILKPLAGLFSARYAPVMVSGPAFAFAGAGGGHGGHDHRHDHDHGHGHGHGHGAADHRHGHAGHDHGHDAHDDHGHDHHGHDHHGHGHGHHHHHHGDGIACDCGHVHAASPALAAGGLDWRKAWTAVVAVGLRPCTGALIVLVFALSQKMFFAGIAATFAMALGTGLTVAALTLMAVSARGLAYRLSGGGAAGARLHAGVEAVGALMILAFGILMLGASLSS